MVKIHALKKGSFVHFHPFKLDSNLGPRTGVIGNASEVVVGGSPGVAQRSKKGRSEIFCSMKNSIQALED